MLWGTSMQKVFQHEGSLYGIASHFVHLKAPIFSTKRALYHVLSTEEVTSAWRLQIRTKSVTNWGVELPDRESLMKRLYWLHHGKYRIQCFAIFLLILGMIIQDVSGLCCSNFYHYFFKSVSCKSSNFMEIKYKIAVVKCQLHVITSKKHDKSIQSTIAVNC